MMSDPVPGLASAEAFCRADGRAPVVLQVLPSLVTGGVERGCLDIAAALKAAGARAIVASEGGPMEGELRRYDALHIKLPLSSKNPFVMYLNAGRLAAAIVENGVDILHARSRGPAWSAWLAARRSGCHFVTTFHAPYGAENALKRRYNAVMAGGERVIAISEFVAEHVRATYGVEAERLRVVHRGVDLLRFDPQNVSAERMVKLARSWHLPDGVPLVLLPGRLTRWKGHELLLEALPRLADLDFRCLLVGSDQGRGAYRRELEALIASRGLTGRVALCGDCQDMPAAYMLADVVVSASSDPEGFGRIVSEAQAMGRPVVVSNHGGAREQILEGETGFSFPPGDPEALAVALRHALTLAPHERALLGERACARVPGLFSKDLMCRRTLAIYQEVLNTAVR
jgi:glycosyltransferase involved in cell wall biosynthesis